MTIFKVKVIMRKPTILLILLNFILISGCAITKKSEFVIYLATQDISCYGLSKIDLSDIKFEDTPIISSDDIISYYKKTHEIKLTASAFERIEQLDIPLRGRVFVVCVDRNPIYAGAFWNPISSVAFPCIIIMKPFRATDKCIIQLQPSPVFEGEDPRSDQRIFQSLKRRGKLR